MSEDRIVIKLKVKSDPLWDDPPADKYDKRDAIDAWMDGFEVLFNHMRNQLGGNVYENWEFEIESEYQM